MRTRAGKAALKEISVAMDKLLIEMRDCSISLSKCPPSNLPKVWRIVSTYRSAKKSYAEFQEEVNALCAMEANLESAIEWAKEDLTPKRGEEK